MSAPSDLKAGGRGRAFYEKVVGSFDLKADEAELLAETARMLDLADALRLEADRGPMVVDGRINPALAELRQVREQIRKTLHSLGLPDEDGQNGRTRQARQAANTRWATA